MVDITGVGEIDRCGHYEIPRRGQGTSCGQPAAHFKWEEGCRFDTLYAEPDPGPEAA